MAINEGKSQKQKNHGNQIGKRGTINQEMDGWIQERTKTMIPSPVDSPVLLWGFMVLSNLFWHSGITTEQFNKGILSC